MEDQRLDDTKTGEWSFSSKLNFQNTLAIYKQLKKLTYITFPNHFVPKSATRTLFACILIDTLCLIGFEIQILK